MKCNVIFIYALYGIKFTIKYKYYDAIIIMSVLSACAIYTTFCVLDHVSVKINYYYTTFNISF